MAIDDGRGRAKERAIAPVIDHHITSSRPQRH